MPSMVVELRLPGFTQGANQINQLAAASQKLQAVVQPLNVASNNLVAAAKLLDAAAARLQRVAPGGGGGGGGRGGGGGGRRAPSFNARLRRLVRSTRLNIGGVSPLAGNLLDVFAALPGPIGLAAKALVGLATVAVSASNALASLGNAKITSGGTSDQIAGLVSLGIPKEEISARAAAFRNAISGGDVFAMGSAARMGIHELPRPFGSTNEAAPYLQALEKLRAMGPGAEQTKIARQFGMEDQLQNLNASPELRKRQQAFARELAGEMTPEALQRAQEQRMEWELLKNRLDLVVIELGAKLLPSLKLFTEIMTQFLGNQRVDTNPDDPLGKHGQDSMGRGYFFDQARRATGGGTGLWEDIRKASSPPGDIGAAAGATIGNLASAMVQNTAAVHANTRAITQGQFGGGARAAGAIPGMWHGVLIGKVMESHALRMGAFGAL